VAESVVAYARSHNFSKLVNWPAILREIWPAKIQRAKTGLTAPDIDLIEIGRAACAK